MAQTQNPNDAIATQLVAAYTARVYGMPTDVVAVAECDEGAEEMLTAALNEGSEGPGVSDLADFAVEGGAPAIRALSRAFHAFVQECIDKADEMEAANPVYVEEGDHVTETGWAFYVCRNTDTGEWGADSFPAFPGADAWMVFDDHQEETRIADAAGANAAIAEFVDVVENWNDEDDPAVAAYWIGEALDTLRLNLDECLEVVPYVPEYDDEEEEAA